MKTFDARYPGKCAGCGENVAVGDTVKFNEDDNIVHDECRDSTTERKMNEMCHDCWTEKSNSGACLC